MSLYEFTGAPNIQRVLIKAELIGRRKPQTFPSLVSKRLGPGRVSFHCTFLGGAFELTGNYKRSRAARWQSEDARWKIHWIKMLSKEQYIKRLEALQCTS